MTPIAARMSGVRPPPLPNHYIEPCGGGVDYMSSLSHIHRHQHVRIRISRMIFFPASLDKEYRISPEDLWNISQPQLHDDAPDESQSQACLRLWLKIRQQSLLYNQFNQIYLNKDNEPQTPKQNAKEIFGTNLWWCILGYIYARGTLGSCSKLFVLYYVY